MTTLAPILQAFFTDRLMTQRAAFPGTLRVYVDFWTSVYQAIDD